MSFLLELERLLRKLKEFGYVRTETVLSEFKRSINDDVVIKVENVIINDAERKILDMLRDDSSLSTATKDA